MENTIDEILHKGNFTSYRKLINKEKGVNGYEYLHEDRCNGNIISILPYRLNNDIVRRDNPYDFLLRYEMTPCWDMEKNVYSSITGGVDIGDDVVESVLKELKEEAGYTVTKDELIYLGTCFGTKSSDTTYYLFTVNLSYKEEGEATGDGSYLEDQAHCEWVDDISVAEDPLVYTSFYRMTREGITF